MNAKTNTVLKTQFLGPPLFFKFYIFVKISFIYSREIQRGKKTQAEGEAGAPWGAQCGTGSQDSGIMP